jgi:hypothetical protein
MAHPCGTHNGAIATNKFSDWTVFFTPRQQPTPQSSFAHEQIPCSPSLTRTLHSLHTTATVLQKDWPDQKSVCHVCQHLSRRSQAQKTIRATSYKTGQLSLGRGQRENNGWIILSSPPRAAPLNRVFGSGADCLHKCQPQSMGLFKEAPLF